MILEGHKFFYTKILITLPNLNQNWSLAQANSTYEKSLRSKISLDCSFKEKVSPAYMGGLGLTIFPRYLI